MSDNKENNIFKILLNDNNVNNYTKLYLILYQMNFYKKNYIPNKLIANRLNIDIQDSRKLLNVFKKKGIIVIYYIGKKKYFKFKDKKDTILDESDYKTNKEIEFDFDYNWLEGED